MILNSPSTIEVLPVGVDCAAFAAGITADPMTGVIIARLSGELLYANDQAARIFGGEKAHASDYIGRSMWSVFPDQWMRERTSAASAMMRTGKPLLVRTVWLGYQVLSWVYPLDLGGEEANARMLIVSRRVPTGACEADGHGDEFDFVESSVVRLGELDVLSPRELEVLALVGQGLSIREIADTLCRSEKTIQNHRDSIGSKLKLANRVKVAEVAQRAGLKPQDAARVRV